MDVPAWPWSHKVSSQRGPRIACTTEVKLITPAWPLASRQTRNYGRHGAPWIQLPHYGIRRTKSPSSIARARAAKKPIVRLFRPIVSAQVFKLSLEKIANKTFATPFISFFSLSLFEGDLRLIKVDYESIEDDLKEIDLLFWTSCFKFFGNDTRNFLAINFIW